MRAVVQESFGGPNTHTVMDVPRPSLSSGDVVLRVRAASVNGLDWRSMRGRPLVGRLMGLGLLRPKETIRGRDVAGRVEAVGRPDSRFKVGDEVFGVGDGTFAEYATAKETELELRGPAIPFQEAGALGVAGCAALQALRDVGHVKPGQRVLITGAGSGVGTFAVQIAKSLGAHVTAVTNPRNVLAVQSLGADEVVDYTKEDVTKRSARFDVVIDISGAGGLLAWRRILAPGGVFVCVGLRKGIGRFVAAGLLRRLFRLPFRVLVGNTRTEDLRELRDMVERGKVHVVIDRMYPLSEVRDAMTYVETHLVGGKVVMSIAGDGPARPSSA